MQELIKVTTNEQGSQVVSARELHIFLEDRQQFSDWIKKRIEKYGLIENQDYILISLNYETKKRGGDKRSTDYVLTLDAAKELAMVQGNEKGKQARRYFIDCETKLRGLAVQVTSSPSVEAVLLQQAQVLTTHAEALIKQSQQLSSQNQRLAELEATVQQIMAGYHPPVRRLPARPQMPRPPRQTTNRKQINELVNAYCMQQGMTQPDAWRWLYDELHRQFSVDIRSYPKASSSTSHLEIAERYGHLDKLYSIIISELYYDDY